VARWVFVGDLGEAKRHARWIFELEQDAGVAIEGSVQRALDSGAVSLLLSNLYLFDIGAGLAVTALGFAAGSLPGWAQPRQRLT
jgi:hypothetical protein